MSSRPLLKPQQVLTDVVANQNRIGLVTNINMVSMVSYNVYWGASTTGTFSVQVCNDYVAPVGVQNYDLDSGHWVPLTLSCNPSINLACSSTAACVSKNKSYIPASS